MIDKVSRGDLLIAYNLIGSYALDRARHDPNFGVIIPQDYALVGSRVALVTRGAAHPVAAGQFLDFLLSRKGQTLLARHNMIPLRTDMASGGMVLRAGNARALHVGPALMADLDSVNRERFLVKWRDTLRLSGTPTRAFALTSPGHRDTP
jgi:iron(III) transport system substrate-binding protein